MTTIPSSAAGFAASSFCTIRKRPSGVTSKLCPGIEPALARARRGFEAGRPRPVAGSVDRLRDEVVASPVEELPAVSAETKSLDGLGRHCEQAVPAREPSEEDARLGPLRVGDPSAVRREVERQGPFVVESPHGVGSALPTERLVEGGDEALPVGRLPRDQRTRRDEPDVPAAVGSPLPEVADPGAEREERERLSAVAPERLDVVSDVVRERVAGAGPAVEDEEVAVVLVREGRDGDARPVRREGRVPHAGKRGADRLDDLPLPVDDDELRGCGVGTDLPEREGAVVRHGEAPYGAKRNGAPVVSSLSAEKGNAHPAAGALARGERHEKVPRRREDRVLEPVTGPLEDEPPPATLENADPSARRLGEENGIPSADRVGPRQDLLLPGGQEELRYAAVDRDREEPGVRHAEQEVVTVALGDAPEETGIRKRTDRPGFAAVGPDLPELAVLPVLAQNDEPSVPGPALQRARPRERNPLRLELVEPADQDRPLPAPRDLAPVVREKHDAACALDVGARDREPGERTGSALHRGGMADEPRAPERRDRSERDSSRDEERRESSHRRSPGRRRGLLDRPAPDRVERESRLADVAQPALRVPVEAAARAGGEGRGASWRGAPRGRSRPGGRRRACRLRCRPRRAAPVSISKSTTPNAQMSARLSTACPVACSGAM